jgi:hypothetical protein
VATVDITPPIGYRMSGYFFERLSTSVHDPLQAKAVVFQQGDVAAVLVICDLEGLPPEVTRPARQDISKKTGIPVANIAISATHTHTGPLFSGALRNALHDATVAREGRDSREAIDYPAVLTGKIVEAATKAHGSMQPMQLESATARQEPALSFNRRFRMKDGSVKTNPPRGPQADQIVEPMGPIDPEVGVLLMRAADNRIVAGLTVFALHQDTTGGTAYSADYAYYLEKGMHETFGPQFTSFFGIGTCGNVNHLDVKAPSQRTAVEIGAALSGTVKSAAERVHRIDPAGLAVHSKTVEVPLQYYPAERVAQATQDMPRIGKEQLTFLQEVEACKIADLQLRPGKTIALEVQAIRLGRDVAIVTLPGEVFVEFGLAIKRASPFKNTLVMELTNDDVAYVPTKAAFAEGSYEPTNSRIAPGGGEIMTETAISLLKSLAE